jgi:predicted RNA-binding protein with RPS1 domain
MRAINYNDMIAVIALGLQSVESRITKLDKTVVDISEKQDGYYLDLSDRMKVISTMMSKVISEDSAGRISINGQNVALNDKTRAALELAVATNGAVGGMNSTLSAFNDASAITAASQNMNLDQLEHAKAKKELTDEERVDEMLAIRESDDKMARQVKTLVKKIDFNSEAWLKKPQSAKVKLADKLAEYEIDLAEVIQLRTNGTDVSLSSFKAQADDLRKPDLADPTQVGAGTKASEKQIYA